MLWVKGFSGAFSLKAVLHRAATFNAGARRIVVSASDDETEKICRFGGGKGAVTTQRAESPRRRWVSRPIG